MAIAALPRTKAKRLWTYDKMVAELPETNQPTELWNGEIVMSPSPNPSHQTIILNFARLLMDSVSASKLGTVFISPLDVILTQHRVVQPDVFYISKARQQIIQDRIRGVPDLAVEVISEGSWHRDRIEKKALYEQFKLPEYWIIDAEARAIEVFALNKGSYQLYSSTEGTDPAKSKLLAGFSVAFSQLEI